MRAPPLSTYTSSNATDVSRTYQVRVAVLVCSGVSTVASLLALYWFCRMEKRFRHQLIVILFFGGLVSSICYFIFGLLSSIRGPIATQTISCQMSGFLIQYGTETCVDYAVFVIAVHSALQVFSPCPPASTDGLRPYRYYVYTGAIFVPALMSGLAFVNPHYGYQSLGAYCMLPIRPFWYRLALQWIPRYLVALIIFVLATAIYTYVGCAIRRYSEHSQSFQDSHLTSGLTSSFEDRDTESPLCTVPRRPEASFEKPRRTRRASSVAHKIVSSPRQGSSLSFVSAGPLPVRAASITPASMYSVPDRVLKDPPRRPSLALIPSGYTIHQTPPPGHGHTVTAQRPHTTPTTSAPAPVSTQSPQTQPQLDDQNPGPLSPILPLRAPSPAHHHHHHMDRQRARIHRQLRLLFIYPLIYTIMWLLPFAMHCMNYRDRYALWPVWGVRLSSNIIITSIGFVNFVVFSVREKPWRKILSSDGTFWGSFVVWKGRRGPGARVDSFGTRGARRSTSGGWEDMGGRGPAPGAGPGRAMLDQPRARLEMEREDRLEAARLKVEAGEGGHGQGQAQVMGEEDEGSGNGKGKGKGTSKDKGKGKQRAVQV
ncbi:hypothetical protein LEMA_P035230.1 [Plenodomus lingam JN3]|uniref:Glucose receptor Git3 N-terminal domain-containing protein n=1 Tax=Leptosphaeria maculans (strain JN3 / isolate v23.1.3 / race Av1-4-5-6-7-8) TaxID=985895 RepID=E4ZRK2_LEPMJ|nr:hypothetical protein LEMA_P035230.1 [Plenodomus lingam JN3]CBX93849.1 hypothetical protein LEMA_P035230.1 [Plenodomus lingam JN3]